MLYFILITSIIAVVFGGENNAMNIENIDGLCIGVYLPGEIGTRLITWKCDESENQKWYYDKKTKNIINKEFNLCIGVYLRDNNIGTNLILWNCVDGSNNQKWKYNIETGTIQNIEFNLCFAFNGANNSGQDIILSVCDGNRKQIYNFIDVYHDKYITSTNGMDIEWMELYECIEDSSVFIFANNGSKSDFEEYYKSVIAVQILPSDKTPKDYDFDTATDEYAVMTKICSNPVIALNNNLDLSWPIDIETLTNPGYTADINYIRSNWLGSDIALKRLVQGDNTCNCPAQDPNPIYDPEDEENDGLFIYQACCNHHGLHLDPKVCFLEYETDVHGIHGLSLWLGFSLNTDECHDIINDDDGKNDQEGNNDDIIIVIVVIMVVLCLLLIIFYYWKKHRVKHDDDIGGEQKENDNGVEMERKNKNNYNNVSTGGYMDTYNDEIQKEGEGNTKCGGFDVCLRKWFLNDVGMDKDEIDEYIQVFIRNDLNNWQVIRNIAKEDLIAIGLTGNKLPIRLKILKAVQKLN